MSPPPHSFSLASRVIVAATLAALPVGAASARTPAAAGTAGQSSSAAGGSAPEASTQQGPAPAGKAASASQAAPAEVPDIGPEGDGPYVFPSQFGWNARWVGSNARPILETVEAKGRVRIAAVGDVPALTVALRAPVTAPAPDILGLDPSRKLLVLADTHGEYEIVVAFLQRQGVIDEKLRWRFGKGQLVVTGDMFDRGAHQLEILWLFYKLEAEAKRKGGALHVLLGNHESMILRGDERYLHPRYPEVAKILGVPGYSALFTDETPLGGWLRSRPAVLKLGDMLFLHGGISPAIVDAKIDIPTLNQGIRTALATPAAQSKSLDVQTQLVAGSSGPQWYRGYFGKGDEATPAAEVDRSLASYGVSRIFVGHTIVEKVTPLYGGKVIAVQVYPHRDETNGAPVLEGALREKGLWYRVGATGLRERLAD